MKYIICASILCFFSVSVVAQNTGNPCKAINIRAPETVRPDETLKAFASFENEKQPSSSKFNWLILKENESSRISEAAREKEQGIIEVGSWKANESGSIILVAEALSQECRQIAVRKVLVLENVGSPLILDEYSVVSWNEETARLDNVISQMQRLPPDTNLFIFVSFGKLSQTQRKDRLVKLLDHLSGVGYFPKSRLTFLIAESEKEGTRFEPIPRSFANDYPCDDCLIIKGADFIKLEKIFHPRSIRLN